MNNMANLPEPLLEGKDRAYTIDALIAQDGDETLSDEAPKGFRKLMGFNLPSWQRDLVWTLGQQTHFIESIFLGLGTGYYVATDVEFSEARKGEMLPTSLLLLDGQQRITAIDNFIKNRLPVFNGIYYDDLTMPQKRFRFRHVGFPCVEVSANTDEQTLKELYHRLNFGGVAHTEADMARLKI